MVGSFAGRGARDPRMTTSSSLRKADVAVRIELGDVDVPVGQRLEPYRAEERLLRLDQQDGLREAGIVEAAAEVYARLDHKYLELIDGESWLREVERIHDLGEHQRISQPSRSRPCKTAAPRRAAPRLWPANRHGRNRRAWCRWAGTSPFHGRSSERRCGSPQSSCVLRSCVLRTLAPLLVVPAWRRWVSSGRRSRGHRRRAPGASPRGTAARAAR